MTSHMDREYLAGKGCQFRPSVKGNNYHISNSTLIFTDETENQRTKI